MAAASNHAWRILKPISSAVSIGTGGPFGAEGPIILTGGAVGSIIGQLFRLTAIERRALLVAGAAAGMSAVFGTPVAATLFGVELLAFELKPRSMVLIGLAAATADGLRMVMAGAGLVAPQPIFPVPAHPPLGGVVLLGAAALGVATGLSAWLMTQAVYRFEDPFTLLKGRLHWMWWPMIGGLIIGLGGLVEPRALGVGYGTIHAELLGQLGLSASGTAVRREAAHLVRRTGEWDQWRHPGPGPDAGGGGRRDARTRAAGNHARRLGPDRARRSDGGVTRSPFTAIVFAFELTHDQNSLLALLVAATVSHLVSVLVLKRSILTEKVARRGFHVMREYTVDPLEAIFVREVMETDVLTVRPDEPVADLYAALPEGSPRRRQRLYPVLDERGSLVGVMPWSRVLEAQGRSSCPVSEVLLGSVDLAHPDEILRTVADRMASKAIGVLPVVERADPTRLVGLITQFDLLQARQKVLHEERHAERVLTLRRADAGAANDDDQQTATDAR